MISYPSDVLYDSCMKDIILELNVCVALFILLLFIKMFAGLPSCTARFTVISLTRFLDLLILTLYLEAFTDLPLKKIAARY